MSLTKEEEKDFDQWVSERPEVIQKAIATLPPTQLYQFKNSKKQCYIVAYTEPDEDCTEVTVVVQKTGVGGPMAAMGLSAIDMNQVFGVHLDDLEPYSEPLKEEQDDNK